MIEHLFAASRDTEAFEFAGRAKVRVLGDILKTGRPEMNGVLKAMTPV